MNKKEKNIQTKKHNIEDLPDRLKYRHLSDKNYKDKKENAKKVTRDLYGELNNSHYKELSDNLDEFVKGLIDDNKSLRDDLNNFSKEKEIEKRDKEIRYLQDNSLMVLTSAEKEKINKFRKKHYKKCKNASCFSYLLDYSSGIGASIEISCPTCGEKEDVTDYNCW